MERAKEEESGAKEEIFEINDFTNATPWEIFIADIERVLHQWGLAASDDHALQDLSPGKQHCKSEQLVYAGRKFIMKLEVSGDWTKSHAHQQLDKRKEAWCAAMSEMMDNRGDFPPKSHPISRWYGVKEFVLIAPDKGVEALTSQAQAKLMLSSISIAISNTQCVVPVFVQMHQQWRHMYLGMCEGNGIRVNFNMIHLKRPPPDFTHLSGLLDIFKGKIARGKSLPSSGTDLVQIAVRYTYILEHWSLDDWPVEPLSDIEGVGKTARLKVLPVGAMSDPIHELHLSAVWPNLSEETVVDRDAHTDLLPTHAPLWTVTVHLADNISCFLSECLHNFLKVCYRQETMEQLTSTSYTSSSSNDNTQGTIYQPFSNALEKLTNTSVPTIGTPFLSSMVQTASQHLEMGLRGVDGSSLPGQTHRDLLKYFFSTGDITSEEEAVNEQRLKIKSAPRGSFSRRLADTLCIINNENGLRVLAELWKATVQELRSKWDRGTPISSISEDIPDMGACLLHQKLQMLNCCIRHKKSHEEKLYTPNIGTNPSQSTSDQTAQQDHTPSDGSESGTDDEFYEALETQEDSDGKSKSMTKTDPIDSSRQVTMNIESSPAVSDFGTKESSESDSVQGRIGALQQCGDLVIMATGKPLCIPVTQDHTPMTEDMMWEQQNVLAKLGTSEEAAKVRAKMQSSSLLSDMQAFKAANPGCLLEDFVRWYSPRDWLEENLDTPPSPPRNPLNTPSSPPRNTLDTPSSPPRSTLDTPSSPPSYSESCDKGEEERGGAAPLSNSGEGVVPRDGEKEEEMKRNDKLGDESSLRLKVEEKEEKEEEDGWGEEEGWGQSDWDVIIDDDIILDASSTDAKELKRFVQGRLSDRMLQPDNLWVETWQLATPLPAYRQKRIFDDTKEAEKVLHFFANLKPSELALGLMPLVLHSAIEVVGQRQKQQPLARVEGLLSDASSLLATVQFPSLDTLPLYQECVSLISQAERLLAAAQSLRGKLHQGLELAEAGQVGGEGTGRVTSSSAGGVASEVAVSTEMMLEGPELVIQDPVNTLVGNALKGLLAAQIAIQDLEGLQGDKKSPDKFRRPVLSPHLHTSNLFPPATWREFILRSSTPSPSPHSQLSPQRMFCVLHRGVEFRIAGGFSSDTNLF